MIGIGKGMRFANVSTFILCLILSSFIYNPTVRFRKCLSQEKVRIGDCGCHGFYYGRGSQPFLHSLLAGRWDRGVLRDRGSQLLVRRLLGGFGSSGRWQVSLMGADMKSLDEGVTTLTVRLLPKASWDLGNTMPFGYLWLSLEFRRNVCVSDLLRPKQSLSVHVFRMPKKMPEATEVSEKWMKHSETESCSNWLLILVDSRLHEGFPVHLEHFAICSVA